MREYAGEVYFIPRMSLQPSMDEIPFKMSRPLFLVKLAFALTVNKAQGQMVKRLGVDLRKPIFLHGQLYTALSRTTSMTNLKAIVPDYTNRRTMNIVYEEVLDRQ